MHVRLPGPLAEFELRPWGSGEPGDEVERFGDEHEVASLLRALVREGSSLDLRALVEQSSGLDEQDLIERMAREIVRGTIEVVRRSPIIMATEPPEYAEDAVELVEPTPFVEPESVRLSVSAEVEWIGLSVSAKVEWIELSVAAEPELLELETSPR